MNYELIIQEIDSCVEWNEYTIDIRNRIVKILNTYTQREKWFSAEEVKPEPLKYVLLQTKEEDMYVGWWDDEEEEFKSNEITFGLPVTKNGYGIIDGWRELPQKYKEKTDKYLGK